MDIVNAGVLSRLFNVLNTAFANGLGLASPDHLDICTVVPSSTGTETYAWLGQLPKMREWLGDRVIQNISTSGYSLINKDFEQTVSVDRNHVLDNVLGQYSMILQQMGFDVAVFPTELVWNTLAAGFTSLCYDGQYFFDTDHPVTLADGSASTYANTDGGAGEPWFLMDVSRPVKPIILQERQAFDFQELTKPTDANVFMSKKFIYGVDGRMNAGYGFPQLVWGSKQPLTEARYVAARAALAGLKGDNGKRLGVKPTLLVTGPANEGAGLQITTAENNAAGATNVYKGTARLKVTPWLAA